jgi:hypothetical protein
MLTDEVLDNVLLPKFRKCIIANNIWQIQSLSARHKLLFLRNNECAWEVIQLLCQRNKLKLEGPNAEAIRESLHHRFGWVLP